MFVGRCRSVSVGDMRGAQSERRSAKGSIKPGSPARARFTFKREGTVHALLRFCREGKRNRTHGVSKKTTAHGASTPRQRFFLRSSRNNSSLLLLLLLSILRRTHATRALTTPIGSYSGLDRWSHATDANDTSQRQGFLLRRPRYPLYTRAHRGRRLEKVRGSNRRLAPLRHRRLG